VSVHARRSIGLGQPASAAVETQDRVPDREAICERDGVTVRLSQQIPYFLAMRDVAM
jgi:hypothetical protein